MAATLSVLLYILFVIAAIVLVVVVLLQEGRGGGFGEALGSHGRETFGPGSKGINTFTGWTAAVFLGSALLLHYINRTQQATAPALEKFDAPANTSAPLIPGTSTPTDGGGNTGGNSGAPANNGSQGNPNPPAENPTPPAKNP
jgi:preprotein translocase subunit SecG